MSETTWYETAIDRWDKTHARDRWWGRWLLAEDEYGDLCLPSVRRRNYWRGRFDARKPWHWPSWLLSRATGAIATVERP